MATFPIKPAQPLFGSEWPKPLTLPRDSTGDTWQAGDFLYLVSGKLRKFEAAAAAATSNLCLAQGDSKQRDAAVDKDILYPDGHHVMPIVEDSEHLFEMTFVDTFADADIGAIVDVGWSSTSGAVSASDAVQADGWRSAIDEPAVVALSTAAAPVFKIVSVAYFGNARRRPIATDVNIRVRGFFVDGCLGG